MKSFEHDLTDLPEILLEIIHDFNFGIIVLNEDFKVVYMNQWVLDASDTTVDQVMGRMLEEIYPEIKTGRILQAVDNCLVANMTKHLSNKLLRLPFPLFFTDFKTQRKTPIAQRLLIKPINLVEGKRLCLIQISDVTQTLSRESYLKKQSSDLAHAVKRIRDKEKHIRAVFENTKDAIITFDQMGQIEDLNPYFEEIFKIPRKQLLGCHIGELIEEINIIESIETQFADFFISHDDSKEYTGIGAKSIKFPVELSLGEMRIDRNRKFVAILRDITDRKKTEKQLIALAKYDQLTGLCNRSEFLNKVEEAIYTADRQKSMFALLFIDLDRIKTINDTLGHQVGDELLVHVAKKLSNLLRKTDIIARFGGDEFTVIIGDLSSIDQIAFIAQKIISGISVEMQILGYAISITSCIGISVYPQNGPDSAQLLKNADTALFVSKENRVNSYSFFSEEMNVRVQERLQLESDLRDAISNNEMFLQFQPQVSLIEKTVIGGEALIRWNHPRKGFVSPGSFIPLAEETALIIPMGEWVINEAIDKLAELVGIRDETIKISINVSSKQFKAQDLKGIILKQVERLKVKPEQIVIEITESHLIEDAQYSNALLNDLKAVGIRIALDDFGTGYSSLSYLKKMPIDILKIDRSFIRDIESNNTSQRILKSMITLAHSLDMEVIAEGVEEKEQLRILQEFGCDIIQGFYFSKPLTFEDFQAYILNDNPEIDALKSEDAFDG